MPRFQPEAILHALEKHNVRYILIGGLAATLHGSPLRTGDIDICPDATPENLTQLALALQDIDARIRSADAPEGLPFACDATFLAQMELLNLTTSFGDLDLSFHPAGTSGYGDLSQNSVRYDLDGHIVPVAALEDIIRSKQAADRDKDRAALPTLRSLLARSRR